MQNEWVEILQDNQVCQREDSHNFVIQPSIVDEEKKEMLLKFQVKNNHEQRGLLIDYIGGIDEVSIFDTEKQESYVVPGKILNVSVNFSRKEKGRPFIAFFAYLAKEESKRDENYGEKDKIKFLIFIGLESGH